VVTTVARSRAHLQCFVGRTWFLGSRVGTDVRIACLARRSSQSCLCTAVSGPARPSSASLRASRRFVLTARPACAESTPAPRRRNSPALSVAAAARHSHTDPLRRRRAPDLGPRARVCGPGGAPRLLSEWLAEHEVEEIVMESTAQYWHPVWDASERDWQPTQRRREDAGPTTGAASAASAVQLTPARPEARFPPMPSDW
jgi:hypothetical protein